MTKSADVALRTYLGIAPLTPEARVLRLIVELGVQAIGGEEGALLVYDRPAGDLVFAMATGGPSAEEELLGRRLPLGEGLTGLAAATREVQIGSPTYTIEGERQPGTHHEPEAVVAAPMLVGDDLVGVITAVSFHSGKRFGAEHASLYAKIASVAGVVVQQRRRIDALEHLSSDPEAPEGGGDADPHATQIVRAVTRLSQAPAADRARVAALLTAVEAVIFPKGRS